jgi:hypothetical protein
MCEPHIEHDAFSICSNFIMLLQDFGPFHDLSASRGRISGFNHAARACLNGPRLAAALFLFIFIFYHLS